MPTWQAIQSQQHANAGWRPATDYRHAMQAALAPITIAELTQALPHYPLAFSQLESGKYQLTAVLSLQSELNLYVDAEGRWQAPYVPAYFRTYPFNLLPNQKGDMVVCVDQDSGLFHEVVELGDQPLFTSEGESTKAFQEAITFMQQRYKQLTLTQQVVNQLAEQNLIQSWPLEIKTGSGEDDVQNIQGLYRVEESGLKSLDSDVLNNLVQSGALAIAYAQLFSMNQINQLTQLAKYHANQKHKANIKPEDIFGEDDKFSFDNI